MVVSYPVALVEKCGEYVDYPMDLVVGGLNHARNGLNHLAGSLYTSLQSIPVQEIPDRLSDVAERCLEIGMSRGSLLTVSGSLLGLYLLYDINKMMDKADKHPSALDMAVGYLSYTGERIKALYGCSPREIV